MWSVTKYLSEDISVNTTINPLGSFGNPWELELGTKRDDCLCQHWQYPPVPTTTCAEVWTHKQYPLSANSNKYNIFTERLLQYL